MSTRETRKERVLRRLQEQTTDDGWIDGYALCHPFVGGSEGLRRLRELRAEGYAIEKRLKPGQPSTTMVHQYRLVTDVS